MQPTPVLPSKRKHKSLSIQDKVELLKKLDSGVSVGVLCEVYSIGQSTIYDIKKQKEKILSFYASSLSQKSMEKRKNLREGMNKEHDQIMMEWYRQRRNDGIELSGSMVVQQARKFHEQLKLKHQCKYTDGWLQRFKARHGITFKRVRSEKRSAANKQQTELTEICKNESDKRSHGDTDGSELVVNTRPSLPYLIELSQELMKGLEQHSAFTELELMSLHLINDKLRKEMAKNMSQLYTVSKVNVVPL